MALPPNEVVTPESQAQLIQALTETLEAYRAGETVPKYRELVYEAYCKDGSTKWIEARLSFTKDESGKPVEVVGVTRDISARKRVEEEREALIKDLQHALSRVNTLSGLLPICASCKKIRDDSGYWSQLETYLSAHSDAEFTHGYCPECADALTQ